MIRIADILTSKINEIQSRLPLKMEYTPLNNSFSDVFNSRFNPSIENSDQLPKINAVRGKIPASIDENIRIASQKYGIDKNLIKAIIKQESDFDTRSLSSAGAQGLMQLMPQTARSLNVSDPWDVAQNIDGGTRYLRDQLDTFKSLRLALAAYNAGPENVKKYQDIPPFAETQDYVQKVLGYFDAYNRSQTSE